MAVLTALSFLLPGDAALAAPAQAPAKPPAVGPPAPKPTAAEIAAVKAAPPASAPSAAPQPHDGGWPRGLRHTERRTSHRLPAAGRDLGEAKRHVVAYAAVSVHEPRARRSRPWAA